MKLLDLSYDGELGVELQLVIPYAYYLSCTNRLGSTASSLDTRNFYYFSMLHQETFTMRRHLTREEHIRLGLPQSDQHVPRLRPLQWMPPPYKKVFANPRFVWPKETLVIMNKFSHEWERGPVNYIDLPELEKIIRSFKDDYQIIYCRPLPENIVMDHNYTLSFADFDLVKSFSGVLTIQDLHRQNPDLSFNTLQLMVYANCQRFISVQGGNSVLASYFGGINVIYAVKGWELFYGDYNHYSLYSGTKIFPCTKKSDFLDCIRWCYGSASNGPKEKLQHICFRQFVKYNTGVVARNLSRLFPGKFP